MFELFVELRRKIIDFALLFDAITFGVSIFSWLNFDAKSSIMACFLMQLPSACRFFRARVSTRASYAPLQPLVVTTSASALRDLLGIRLLEVEQLELPTRAGCHTLRSKIYIMNSHPHSTLYHENAPETPRNGRFLVSFCPPR